MSYAPGAEVLFHASTTAREWSLEIVRDGAVPQSVHQSGAIPGRHVPIPEDVVRLGCGWPVAYRWTVPSSCASGFFRVIASCERPDGTRFVHQQFFVVRPHGPRRTPFLLVLPTATWTAYNDWGGANHYQGRDGYSPVLSLKRPWRHGLVWLPEGAPRIVSDRHRPPLAPPQYRMKEWALANGFGQYASAAGWAQFDRHFVVWAERNNLAIDMITQTDLHYRPELLDGYRCLIFVGHDEYWSATMRDHVDHFVEGGGKVARFAGNFLWQIRLEDEGRTQICYKYDAASEDPVRGTDQAHLLTSAWEDRLVSRPGAQTFGVNALRGMYASWGGFAPAGTRGFTTYQPGHWAFAGTGLRYGDILGDASEVFGYEVDGLEYGFERGLPYPTGADGAPNDLQILAMAPATLAEDVIQDDQAAYYIRNADLAFAAQAIDGEVTPEALDRRRRGSGMIVHFGKGKGEVFTAGTCEWIMGLTRADQQVHTVTMNVLRRFSAG
ncbi:N,N-dimethylformamidase beta subunit family domain-containing protein [Novosphingobium cyanobacteriorum]|uniref:N,N-dimethylformamidase beta subunit-like C-terminal domain-containing protein n=1 Tax=Novosphingobium cyanobacteriorum TaxID=3024215 RepID=A0ABT6CFV0_9SPHN|nr:N,N-dimethylformamidase beta subunit family domain-containing protein [Novosphingobium cyanobacteriorum]MDF8332800.1 hypothetical protein [Novosphingobium cyanobacteriorum]